MNGSSRISPCGETNAITIPVNINPIITMRYLSIQTLQLQNNISFLNNQKLMNVKILEVIGFGFIAGTIYSFLGLVPNGDPLGWPVFWGCAIGALAIIIYRNYLKKKAKK